LATVPADVNRTDSPSESTPRGVAAAVPTGFPVDSMAGGWGVQPPSLVPNTNFCGQAPDSGEKSSQNDPMWETLRQQKRMNWRIGAALRQFPDTADEARRMNRCGQRYLTGEMPDGGIVTEAVWFCDHRLCPTCRMRRAIEWAKKLAPIYQQSEFTLDGNGLLVRSEAALAEAQRKFAQQAIMDADMGKPDRSVARARKLDRMVAAETMTLYPLFITLTIPNIEHLVEIDADGNVTRNNLDELLWEPFRRLRETARRRPKSRAGRLWSLIAGGLWVTEVTQNVKDKTFHPHLHLVVWSRKPYIHPLALQRLWGMYADGAERIDVRKATPALAQDAVKDVGDNLRGLVAYMLGGMAKKSEETPEGGADFRERRYSRDFWHEVALATANRRLINTFGFLREFENSQVVADYEAAAMEDQEDREDEPQTVGMHVVREWDWKSQQYVIRASWPASAEDPIVSMEARLSMLAGNGVIVSQLDRQAVSRSWTEFANIAAWNTG